MKFTKTLLLLLIAGSAYLLTSCEEDGILPLGPTITFNGNPGYTTSDVTVTAGDAIMAGVTATDDDRIETFEFMIEYSATPGNPFVRTIDVKDQNFAWDTTMNSQNTAGTETWTFKVTNRDGLSATRSFVVTTTAAGGMINTFTATLLGDQGNPTLGSFYSTVSNSVFLLAAATASSDSIDFCYYNGATNMNTLASPDDGQVTAVFPAISSWTTRNSTKFGASAWTAAQFDAVTDDSAFTDATPDTHAPQLADGDVVAFETAGGKKGLFKVVMIDNPNNSMTIDVKVQQ